MTDRLDGLELSVAPIGVQFHGMWDFYTDADRSFVLGALASAGCDSVRMDVSWAMIQPERAGRFDAYGTKFVDRVINLINSFGMKPLITWWLTPAWANEGKGEHVLPDDPRVAVEAAQYAAELWGDKVLAWEVWNEENSPDFLQSASPKQFADLVGQVSNGLATGHMGANILLGGLQYNDVDYLSSVLDFLGPYSYDGIAVHPYTGKGDDAPGPDDDGSKWTFAHVETIRDLMVERGIGHKPIWFTEFGWSSHPNTGKEAAYDLGVSEAQQASFLTQTKFITQSVFPYVERMYWYNERDLPEGSTQVRNYGLLRSDLTPKPAYLALAMANREK